MKTALLLNNSDARNVWPMLNETTFSDNGGEPDGNAWLTTDFDQSEAAAVVNAGFGRIVPVKTATHEAMTRYLGMRWTDFDDSTDERDFVHDVLFSALNDRAGMVWAYYSSDKRFVFVEGN